MTAFHDPRRNHLLAALPATDFERLRPHLTLVPLTLGEALYESGIVLRHVYFPTDSIVSLLYVMADGASAEIAVVGNEGVIGVSLFMGGETTPSRAVVQSAGHAYRLTGQLLKEEFTRAGTMQHLLLRYTQSLADTDGADRRLQSPSFARSAIVPLAAAESRPAVLQPVGHDAGIDCEHARCAARRRHGCRGKSAEGRSDQVRRGHITVLDRPGLEARTCECYAVVKKESDRLLPYLTESRAGPNAPRTLEECAATFRLSRPRERPR